MLYCAVSEGDGLVECNYGCRNAIGEQGEVWLCAGTCYSADAVAVDTLLWRRGGAVPPVDDAGTRLLGDVPDQPVYV